MAISNNSQTLSLPEGRPPFRSIKALRSSPMKLLQIIFRSIQIHSDPLSIHIPFIFHSYSIHIPFIFHSTRGCNPCNQIHPRLSLLKPRNSHPHLPSDVAIHRFSSCIDALVQLGGRLGSQQGQGQLCGKSVGNPWENRGKHGPSMGNLWKIHEIYGKPRENPGWKMGQWQTPFTKNGRTIVVY